MKSLFSAELFKLALLSIIGLLVGYQWQNVWLGLSAALALYIFTLLYYYRRYHEWLSGGGSESKPFTNMFWSTNIDQTLRLLNDLRDDKRLLQADVEYFKESFQALESGIIVVDKRGRIDWCNLAAKPLLGVELERDRGQSLVNLIRAPEAAQYLESQTFDSALEIASPINIDMQLEIQAAIFRQDYKLIFIRNVSEVYKLETMRRDFVANVSHELRTPLTVITGYLDTLSDHTADLPDLWGKAIGQMLVQSHRMDSMVEDLIWLSRLESLPADADDIEPVPLEGILSSVVSDMRLSSAGASIDLDMDNQSFECLALDLAYPIQLRGSYTELRSAFGNLVQNAVKYSGPDGDVTVHCYRYRDSVVVKVADTGEGIDPVHIPRLTERFYRADSSRTPSTGGTGLGLAIVKHVLARHEAELEVSSKLGKGSKFSCIFPLSRLQVAARK